MRFSTRSGYGCGNCRSRDGGCWRRCMRAFDYAAAGWLAGLAAVREDVRPLAGGTDLLPLMKADVVAPSRLVDVKRVGELGAGIVESADGVSIGALTTLSALESSGVLRERYAAVA